MKKTFVRQLMMLIVALLVLSPLGAWPAEPQNNWETVEQLKAQAAGYGLGALGVAIDHHHAIYAVGYWGNPTNWLVRRSVDGGKSWDTVGNLDPSVYGPGSVANSVVIDGHDTVYVYGFSGSQVPGRGGYLVRKSADQGVTWKTVYEQATNGPGLDQDGAYLFKRIAIDGSGTLYIIVDYSKVLRSTDSGEHWEQVETFPGVGTSLVATLDGGVAVAGLQYDSTTGANWIVRYSSDGKKDWKTVDTFPWAQAFGICASRPGGKIAAVGVSYTNGIYHWVARAASTRHPDQWRTVDDYVPSTDQQPGGSTMVNDCVLTKEGTLFVTGRTLRNDATSGPVMSYLTRSGRIGESARRDRPFYDSDELSVSTANAGALILKTGGQAAAVDWDGDIYTVGAIYNPAVQAHDWLVRVLHSH